MATGGSSETAGLGKFVKTQAKYGTTTNSTYRPTNESFIKHTIKTNDTLQGLALMYAVTVSET